VYRLLPPSESPHSVIPRMATSLSDSFRAQRHARSRRRKRCRCAPRQVADRVNPARRSLLDKPFKAIIIDGKAVHDHDARMRSEERSMVDAGLHWEKVYQTKQPTEVSWYRPHLDVSIQLIADAAGNRDARMQAFRGKRTARVAGEERTLEDSCCPLPTDAA
jgi:hypothetical protein